MPSELEVAIETAVGGRLQEVVVDSWSNAQAAISHLKTTNNGRATFLPLDNLRPPSSLKVPKTKGIIGIGTDLVTFDNAVTPAVENLLNRLLIVEDLDAAKAAFDAMQGGFQIVTRAGEIVRSGGSVTGGKRNNRQQGGFLAREREWRELPDQISEVETALSSLESQISENAADVQSIEAEISNLQSQYDTISLSINETRDQVNQATAKLSEIRNQTSWQEKSQATIVQDIETHQARQTTFTAEITQFIETREAAEQQLTTLSAEIATLSAEALKAEQNRTASQMALIQEKRRNQQNLLNNYQDNLNQTQSQLGHRQTRVKALGEQRQLLLDQLTNQQTEHTLLVAQVTEFTDKIDPAEADLKVLEGEQTAFEKTESQERNQLRRLEAETNRFSLEYARQQDKMQDLQRQIEDDFGLVQLDLSEDQVGQPVLPIQSMVTQLPTVEEPPEGMEDDIRRLKIQMRQLGNINPEAPKEHAELNERHEFLTNQMNDLETAAADLKSVIVELDKIMETAFTETFTGVAKAFQDYFKILFDGGEAQLTLTDPDNIAETGIDVVARPPGKRPQNLELLSGGERSLTAQALIFALLKTSPTPYVIFDEVDAMLDEANVDRFRKALVALSQDIQFIVITHNRKTIEVANTIYGIFMRENAISEAVSLKLDDFSNQESEHLSFEYAS